MGLLCIAMLASHGAAHAKPVPVPAMTSRVMDLTNTLSAGEAQALREDIRAIEQSTQAQLAVLILPTTGPDAIEQYATRVFAQWKLGHKDEDDGVLLLVALKDRKMRIEVGTGLEGTITDIQAARVIDQDMKPRFRDNDYAGGIQAAVQSLSRLIEASSVSGPVDEEQSPPEEHQPSVLRRLVEAFSTNTSDSEITRTALVVMAWTLAVGVWHGSRPPLPSGPRVAPHGIGKRSRNRRRAAEHEGVLWAELQTEAPPTRWRRWPMVLALLAVGPIAATLVRMNFAMLFLFMPVSFMYVVGYLSGHFKTARRVFGGVALAIAGLLGLGFYLGADKVPWLIGGLFIACFVGIGIAVVVVGIRFHAKRGVLGFVVRLVLVTGVIGFAFMQFQPGPEPDESWLALALVSFIAMVFGFFPASSAGQGDGDDNDDDDDGGSSSSSSDSSSSSSSDSSSPSGDGGSSSGGGASDSW